MNKQKKDFRKEWEKRLSRDEEIIAGLERWLERRKPFTEENDGKTKVH